MVRGGFDGAQAHRQRCRRKACAGRFDDPTGTVLAGRHRPLRAWVLCLRFAGLDLSNRRIAEGLELGASGAQAVAEAPRNGSVARVPPVRLAGEVEIGEAYVVRGRAQGPAGRRRPKGRLGRRRKPKAPPGRGAPEKDEPPVLGPIQPGGRAVPRMPADARRRTIRPVIGAAVARDAPVHTDGRNVCTRLPARGHRHKTVRHGHGECARDGDGDGSCGVHVDTAEGTWSSLRSRLRPHRGVSREKPPLCLGSFGFVHNARRRGEALLGGLVGALVTRSGVITPDPNKSHH